MYIYQRYIPIQIEPQIKLRKKMFNAHLILL